MVLSLYTDPHIRKHVFVLEAEADVKENSF